MKSFAIIAAGCCCLIGCAQAPSPSPEAAAARANAPAYSSFNDVELCRAASQAPVGSGWQTTVPNVYAVNEAQLRSLTLKGCKDLVDTAEARARTPVATGNSVVKFGPPAASAAPSGPKRIKVTEYGGMFRVPVLVNHALQLNFVLDSGASSVTIPSDVVATLAKVGTIAPSDFRETRNHVLADGRSVAYRTFIIRSLTLGDLEISNVVGSETAPGSPLLLGQSFLRRFQSWSIDNARAELVLQ